MPKEETLARLERIAREGNTQHVYEALRQLSLRETGELLLDVPASCAALRGMLPAMPSAEVQINWTGTSGAPLLDQSLAFVGAVSTAFESHTGRSLSGARILDYGCGWGRLIRLMYKFSPPERIYGCDAWETSLALCRGSGIRAHLATCEEVPTSVPFPGVSFDLIYAFSVFTHLSERTSKAVVATLRRCIEPDGLLVVTIRPPEYWDVHSPQQNAVDVPRMKKEHAARGFAFTPHIRAPVDGEVTFGDTSMSLDYIGRNWKDWSVLGSRVDRADPLQTLVFLAPV